MTSAGLLDQLVSLIPTRVPDGPAASKAVTGTGAWSSATNPQLSAFQRDPQRMARVAQDAYLANRHIRAAERLISQRFATVDWHLEDGTGTKVGREDGDNSDPAYLAVLDLLERPYRPEKGDPLAAVPKTRSSLWNITCRHKGLAGYGFWYLDEAEAFAGTPRSLLYINPARMRPALDKAGSLVGWALDPDSPGGGTPLEADSVIVFHLEQPDSGHLGAGLVESALTMVDLTRYADRHATGVLAAGGRLAGAFSPRGDNAMEEEVYKQLVLDMRAAAEDPQSARRVNILRGPVDFTKLSATPAELDLVAVMNLSRDEVSELWNVPRTQVGGKGDGGLNSGSSKGYDEAVLWQNAVGPRLRSFAETLQYELLDRYAALGVDVRIVIEEPEFDDETPMYERASKATTLPLTNRERREQVGLDPFGDERDDEVWMASTMTRVYPERETPPQLAPFTGPPQPPAPTPDEEAPGVDEIEPRDEGDPTEADTIGAMKAATEDVRTRGEAVLRRDVAALLRTYGQQVAARARDRFDHLSRKPTDVDVLFSTDRMERDLLAVIRPHLLAIAEGSGGAVAQRFGKASAVELRDPVIERLLRGAGVRIKGISETTRLRVVDIVRQGIADGLSAAQLGDRIEAASGLFDELRAETIARTETATVLNQAALAQYTEFGVDRVQVVDGDEDDACAEADGAIWTVDQAEADPIAHPNCVRTFTPLVGEAKAMAVEPMDPVTGMADAVRLLAETMANRPAPTITVPVTVENRVDPTPVTVENHTTVQPAPVTVTPVAIPAPIVTMPDTLRIASMPERVTRREVTKRTPQGGIAETVDIEADL